MSQHAGPRPHGQALATPKRYDARARQAWKESVNMGLSQRIGLTTAGHPGSGRRFVVRTDVRSAVGARYTLMLVAMCLTNTPISGMGSAAPPTMGGELPSARTGVAVPSDPGAIANAESHAPPAFMLQIADSANAAAVPGTPCLRLRDYRPAVPSVTRGGSKWFPAADLSVPMLVIARSTRALALSIPKPHLPKDARVRMELRGADGRTLFTSEQKRSDFPEHASIVMSNHGQPLEAGRYQLTLAETQAKPKIIRVRNLDQGIVVPPDSVVFAFELRTAN